MPHRHSHGHGHGHGHSHGSRPTPLALPSPPQNQVISSWTPALTPPSNSPSPGEYYEEPPADGYTTATKWGEGIISFWAYTCMFGNMLDNITGAENKLAIQITIQGLLIGLVLASLGAWGSATSHSIVNAHNEGRITPEREEEEDEGAIDEDLEDNNVIIQLPEPKLSAKQKLRLSGDFIVHTGELATPLTFCISKATKDANLAQGYISSWQVIVILFSSFCSWANVRTCKNCTKEEHGYSEPQKADIFTWSALVGESLSTSVGCTYWLGDIVDDFFNLKLETFELSWEGFGVGLTLGILAAISSAYYTTLTNINYQKNIQLTADIVKNTSLSCQQTLTRPLQYLANTSNYAPKIDFTLDNMTSGRMPRWARNTTHVLSLLASTGFAYADFRSCMFNAKKYNKASQLEEAQIQTVTEMSSSQRKRDLHQGLLSSLTPNSDVVTPPRVGN